MEGICGHPRLHDPLEILSIIIERCIVVLVVTTSSE